MSDPLDAVFVTGNESAELKRAATARALAAHLARMPAELRAMFGEQFQHITSAELAQLRYRIAMLEVLDGDDGLIAANRLMDACERGDIPQQLMPDIQEARNEIVALRATVAEARELLTTLDWNDWDKRVDDWLAANASQEGG